VDRGSSLSAAPVLCFSVNDEFSSKYMLAANTILSWSTMSGNRKEGSKASILTKDATDSIKSVGFFSGLLDDSSASKELPSLKEALRTHVKLGKGRRGGKKDIKVVIVANKFATPDNTAGAEAVNCYNRLVRLYGQHKEEGIKAESGERICEDIITVLKSIDAVTIKVLVTFANKSTIDEDDFSVGAVTFRSKDKRNLIYVTNIAVATRNGYLDDSLFHQSDYQKEVLSFLTSTMKEIHLLLAFPKKRQGLHLDLHSCIMISKNDEEEIQAALTALDYFPFKETKYLTDGMVSEMIMKNTKSVLMIQSGKNIYGMQSCFVLLIVCVITFCQQITSDASSDDSSNIYG